jgi:hypothetical protein
MKLKNIITLAVIFLFFFFLYRSCTVGYDDYAYFVRVNDEAVFIEVLSEGDSRIEEHGRRLKTDVLAMDRDQDQGTGAGKGVLRWYDCMGIDCDEGWQRSFLPTQ